MIILIASLLCVLSWWPQTNVATKGSGESADLLISTNVELVILDVSVKDPKGGYALGLTAADFRVLEDDKPQVIKHFSVDEQPVTMGLVVDTSGSMRQKRPGVVTAALALVGASNPHDEIFVVNFNDQVKPGLPANIPFSDDIQTLRSALWMAAPEGRTKLYDALDYSLGYLAKGRMDKKTLVVVSDGGDNASTLTRKDITEKVEQSRATVYGIDIYDENDPDSKADVLKKIAQVSGGEFFQLREIPQVLTVCKKIAEDIRHRYTIAYVPSHVASRPVHLIKVTASSPNKEKLIVRTRSRYMVPERHQ